VITIREKKITRRLLILLPLLVALAAFIVSAPSYGSNPHQITDDVTPYTGNWQTMIGRRDFYQEPRPYGDDYLWTEVAIPSEIDEVEVKYINITIWYRYEGWDSAEFDPLDIWVEKIGGGTLYLVQEYNPNPGYSYEPYADSGWRKASVIVTNVAGSTIRIKIHLHTYRDRLYKSWVYIDDVSVKTIFKCIQGAQLLKISIKKNTHPSLLEDNSRTKI